MFAKNSRAWELVLAMSVRCVCNGPKTVAAEATGQNASLRLSIAQIASLICRTSKFDSEYLNELFKCEVRLL